MTSMIKEADEEVSSPPLFWVAAYLTQRHYGGPEEGGWWFDRGELVSDPRIYADLQGTPTAFLSEAEAALYVDRLRSRLPSLNEGRRPLDSVLSEGMYEIEVIKAATLPTFDPEYWSRYE